MSLKKVSNASTSRGQRVLRKEPNSVRAVFLRGVLAERGESVEQFLKRSGSWIAPGRRFVDSQLAYARRGHKKPSGPVST